MELKPYLIKATDNQGLAIYVQQLHAYYKDNFPDTLDKVNWETLPAFLKENYQSNPNRQTYLFYLDSQLAGFADIMLCYPFVDQGMVLEFCVLPPFRRQYVGEKMVEYLHNHVQKAGLKELLAEVRLDNDRAISFWGKQGFAETRKVLALKISAPSPTINSKQ